MTRDYFHRQPRLWVFPQEILVSLLPVKETECAKCCQENVGEMVTHVAHVPSIVHAISSKCSKNRLRLADEANEGLHTGQVVWEGRQHSCLPLTAAQGHSLTHATLLHTGGKACS